MRWVKNIGAIIMMASGVTFAAAGVGPGLLVFVLGFVPFVIGRMAD